MARLAKAWPCLASALLVNLAFPPFNLGLLVFVGLAPWLASLRESTGKQGWKSGWTFGFLLCLGQFAWMFAFVNHWTHNPAISILPYLAGSAFVACYFGLLGWLLALAWQRKWIWTIPILWAGVEVFRSYLPVVAFPYGLIATPLWPYPQAIQTAYYGSIYLTGAWVLLLNVVFALYLAGQGNWLRLRGYLSLFVLGLVVSIVRFEAPTSAAKATITVGQPGVDLAFGNPDQNNAILKQTVADFYTQARRQQSDLLVLPEGISGPDGSFPPTPVFKVENNPPILFGGQRGSDNPRYQTAFAYDGKWSYADKTRLVIFGEFVPLRDQLPFLASAFQLPGGDLTPGDELKALQIGKIKVGPLLCFEGLFPDLSYKQAKNGAQLLAVMSVDDWYFGTPAPDQLMAASVWRAVETGLPLVRAASLGYSFAVDPRGNMLGAIPTTQRQTLRVEVPIADPNTSPFFPVFPIASCLSLVALPLAYRIKKTNQAPQMTKP